MKNVIFTAILSFGLLLMNIVSLRQTNAIIKTEMITEKFDIKIKEMNFCLTIIRLYINEILTFESEEFGKSYLVYQLKDDETGEYFAASFNPEDGDEGNLNPIETDEEWDLIEEVLESFLEEEDEEHDHDHDHDCDHDHEKHE